ncbi:site-specific integrase [Microcystis phage MinS1]|nr:site-specific integrase [Microcystis phage MinS1]
MAWAEKLPSGRWRASYRDAAGRQRSAGTFPHKPKAERAAAAAEEAARRRVGDDLSGARRPWGAWCVEWWPTRMVEESTRITDEGRRRNHLEPRWAQVPLGAITRQDVKAWAAGLVRDGMSPSTATRVVHLLSASLNAAVDAELIQVNPAARIRIGQGEQEVERFLTRSEVGRILDELPTTHDQLIVETLVHTGLRWGELAGLHRHRVDFDAGQLRVVETFVEKAERVKGYPKGRQVRSVPLTRDLVARLAALESRPAPCGYPHFVGSKEVPCRRAGLLLVGANGGVLRNSNWSERVWRPAVERANVGDVRIHDLRHTYASWLLQGGRSLAEVGKLLGHVSPLTTQRYAHLEAVSSTAVLNALGPSLRPSVQAVGDPDSGRPAPRLPHARDTAG